MGAVSEEGLLNTELPKTGCKRQLLHSLLPPLCPSAFAEWKLPAEIYPTEELKEQMYRRRGDDQFSGLHKHLKHKQNAEERNQQLPEIMPVLGQDIEPNPSKEDRPSSIHLMCQYKCGGQRKTIDFNQSP